MQAIVFRKNGAPDVLSCEEIEKPKPEDDEVLLKVSCASINPLDWRMMRGSPLMRVLSVRRKPKLSHPGVDVAGVVEEVGSKVTEFKPGDAVFGACHGAFAEYACAPARCLALKPAALTFDDASSIPIAGITALQALRDHGRIQRGQKVLINGASGGVGTFAVQLAKYFGAEVTGVCSGANAGLVRSLGADRVVDYTREDFTRDSERYDVVLDNMGNHSLVQCRRILNPKGRCVIIGGPKQISRIFVHALGAMVFSWLISQKLGMMVAKITAKDLAFMADLMQSGKVRPVIDRRYKLVEAPEAFGYMEEEHARGKVLITVAPTSDVTVAARTHASA